MPHADRGHYEQNLDIRAAGTQQSVFRTSCMDVQYTVVTGTPTRRHNGRDGRIARVANYPMRLHSPVEPPGNGIATQPGHLPCALCGSLHSSVSPRT
ncbi:MAG: hypothetical protein D6725_10910 [Planctomycetota bacterium]|nr:MAG: hypothetical protein D6725_10910 [Planctomycetota bacterium]